MRKKVFLKRVVLFIIYGFIQTYCSQAIADEHTVIASVQKNVFTFGETIQVSIRYRNNASSDWSVQKPDDSLSAVVYCARTGDADKRCFYSSGRIESIPFPDGRMAFAEPEPQYIIIKPGREYVFTSEIPWSCIFPGKWVLQTEEKTEKVRSEPVSFQIEFTKDSPDILLNTAKNIEEKAYKRKMYTKYLRELKTDIPYFKWPHWRDTPEEKNRKEALIQKKLKEFEAFWNKERNSPDTEKAIERINKVCREITESSSRKSCPDILEFRR